jgi:hypothetical protein
LLKACCDPYRMFEGLLVRQSPSRGWPFANMASQKFFPLQNLTSASGRQIG